MKRSKRQRGLWSRLSDPTRAIIVTIAIIAGIVAAIGSLGGCGKVDAPPPYVVSVTPALPAECDPADVKPAPEPKVKADIPEGVSDLAAVKDRERWKTIYRAEKDVRSTCWERLMELFPDQAKLKGGGK